MSLFIWELAVMLVWIVGGEWMLNEGSIVRLGTPIGMLVIGLRRCIHRCGYFLLRVV